MNLYEIVQELQSFNYEYDEDGVITNLDKLDELELAKDEKVENICLFIKNLLADAEAYKNEKNTFADREKRAKNKAESLKRYLANMLNGEKWKSDKAVCNWRKSDVVVIDDLSAIPKQYIKIKEDADKTELKKALKNGETITGTHLEEKNNLSIK